MAWNDLIALYISSKLHLGKRLDKSFSPNFRVVFVHPSVINHFRWTFSFNSLMQRQINGEKIYEKIEGDWENTLHKPAHWNK